jgi:hypothetical protein
LAVADAGQKLHPTLNPDLARRVYAGEEGTIYIVPAPGSVCLVAVSAGARETMIGLTSTDLAASDGLGNVRATRGGPITFAGVLPAGAHDVRILDEAGRSIAVPLSEDDGYWVSAKDPRDMRWRTGDGRDHQGVFGRANMYKAFRDLDD